MPTGNKLIMYLKYEIKKEAFINMYIRIILRISL